MVFEKKSSARVAEAGQRRVLDDATRQRRLNRQLDALEKDNFQDDPLSSLPPSGPTARLPAFSEGEEPGKKKRKTRGDHFKQRFRKNFQTLLEEENVSEREEPNYLSAAAPPSSLPLVCSAPSVDFLPPTPVAPVGALLFHTLSYHAQRDQVSEDDSVAADLTIPGHAHKMWMVNSSTSSCIECYNTGTGATDNDRVPEMLWREHYQRSNGERY